jgi:hypothetical protein
MIGIATPFAASNSSNAQGIGTFGHNTEPNLNNFKLLPSGAVMSRVNPPLLACQTARSLTEILDR